MAPNEDLDEMLRSLNKGKREEEEEEEGDTQQPTYSRPPTPVSPAPPPSAGVGGSTSTKSDPGDLDAMLREINARNKEQEQEKSGNLNDYTGDTFEDIGIELSDRVKKDLGEGYQVPYTRVEKEYLSKSLPEFRPFGWEGGGRGGQEAIDMVKMRNDLAKARQVNWIRDFRETNDRAPTRAETKSAWANFHNDANQDIYREAQRSRGQRPSALIGSSGQPNKIFWYDYDTEGHLHGGLGPVRFGGEDRGWVEKMVSPALLTIVGGAEHTIVTDEVDKDGKPTGKYVMPVYNEAHALGWLDWVGRLSLVNTALVAGVAGGADSPLDFLKPFGFIPGNLENYVIPDSWINPIVKGWGTDEHLKRTKRGEDYVSVSGELALGGGY